jgi:hypothetical protein
MTVANENLEDGLLESGEVCSDRPARQGVACKRICGSDIQFIGSPERQ